MKPYRDRIKNETQTLHNMAERAGFNKSLMSGKATKESYCKYLTAKMQIFSALEEAINFHKTNEVIKKSFIDGMQRSQLIKQDIQKMGFDKLMQSTPLSSVQAYTYHIQRLSKKEPELLSAHIYTLYLADMAGGMIIKKILKSQYQFQEAELNAYDFHQFSDLKKFIMDYHQVIAQIVEQASLHDVFIEESKLSYILSMAMLIELEAA